MLLDYRDASRRKIGRLMVDTAQRPTRVRFDDGREVFLHWDNAVDDAGQLRRCVACGCPNLFRDRAFPQVTSFVVILAFAGAIISALGLATPPILVAMSVVFVLDVSIFLFSKRRLTCYRCRSTYRQLPIAPYHRNWDRAIAEKHPPPTPTPGTARPARASS
ncbi:MAG: hypothetical protein KDA25_01435 [Phycisphaerales bacterium]|nr:hypothetical protein [Phycisphaerales bacterium]